jgi:hypothetical protein
LHGKSNKANAKLFLCEFLQGVQKIRKKLSMAGLLLKNIFLFTIPPASTVVAQ